MSKSSSISRTNYSSTDIIILQLKVFVGDGNSEVTIHLSESGLGRNYNEWKEPPELKIRRQ